MLKKKKKIHTPMPDSSPKTSHSKGSSVYNKNKGFVYMQLTFTAELPTQRIRVVCVNANLLVQADCNVNITGKYYVCLFHESISYYGFYKRWYDTLLCIHKYLDHYDSKFVQVVSTCTGTLLHCKNELVDINISLSPEFHNYACTQ